MHKITWVLTISFFISVQLSSQSISMEDYERAVSYSYSKINNKRVFNLQTRVNWFKDGTGFWYNFYDENGKYYKKLLFKNPNTSPLFTQEELAKNLSKKTGEEINPLDLSINVLEVFLPDSIHFRYKEKDYSCSLSNYTLKEKSPEIINETNQFEKKSPDGKWIAFVDKYNLKIRSIETGEEYKLTQDGNEHYQYGSYYGWFDKMEGEGGNTYLPFGYFLFLSIPI